MNTLRLVSEPLERRTAALGETLTFVCVSTGAFPPPKLTLKLSGRDLQEVNGGSVAPAMVEGRENDKAVQGEQAHFVFLMKVALYISPNYVGI
jgi:hypothetical protein